MTFSIVDEMQVLFSQWKVTSIKGSWQLDLARGTFFRIARFLERPLAVGRWTEAEDECHL